jgi:tetratricopeptide (TPR) repeat protein
MSPVALSDSQQVAAAFNAAPHDEIGLALADELRERWDRGEKVDALILLAEHPEHAANSCVVVDLAHEEFCLRRQTEENIDIKEFSARFPRCQAIICHLLEVLYVLERGQGELAQNCDLLPWPRPDREFLGFNLCRELGRGTFARVFLAREPALGDRLVALKVAQALGSEARTLGPLNHPNIVPIHSLKRDPETNFVAICMPYQGAATLHQIIEKDFDGKRMPRRASAILARARNIPGPAEANDDKPDSFLLRAPYVDGVVHLGIQIAAALEYMHARGICHRDLKPSNVLLSLTGKPMLLDFNLALNRRVRDAWQGGTVPYMAPEQLRALASKDQAAACAIDGRADIFAFGVLLYELLAGVHPFGPMDFNLLDEKAVGRMLHRLQRAPWPLRGFNPDVDRGLEELIERCLAWAPEDRPQSAAGLAIELRACLSRGRRALRWVKTHKIQAAVAATLLVTALATSGFSFATREPEYHRQLRAAQEGLARGDFESAVLAADRALHYQPRSGEALFSRGYANEQRNQIDDARRDFKAAEFLLQDAPSLSYVGYFYTQNRQWLEAIQCYQRAQKVDARGPVIANNLAYCYYKVNELDMARRVLDEAIAAAPHLGPLYLNRAMVDLQAALLNKAATTTDVGLADMEMALAIGPKSPELLACSARLLAFAARKDESKIEPALARLGEAMELGYNLRSSRTDPAFSAIAKHARFVELAETPTSEMTPAQSIRILNPRIPIQLPQATGSSVADGQLRGKELPANN